MKIMDSLKGRSFLTLKDFTPEEIRSFLDLAADLKAKKKQGVTGNSLKGKNIALIFEKPSTRTRCAFTVAANDEGGFPPIWERTRSSWGKKRALRIRPAFSAECSTASNSGAFPTPMWRSWQGIPAWWSGTALRTNTIPPRFWQTFSPWKSSSAA